MKLFASLAAVALLIVAPEPGSTPLPANFRYQRQIILAPSTGVQSPFACALLDADVFAHTQSSLGDLRLFVSRQGDHADWREAPFAITLSRTSTVSDAAQILNFGLRGKHHLSFDLAMPQRAYSSVDLMLAAHDFFGSTRVTGLRSLNDRNPTYLGVFSVFDLSQQHLGRSTHVALSESTFPYLHIDLIITPAPGGDFVIGPSLIGSVDVPPSRVAQTLYTNVAETSEIVERSVGHSGESVASFTIPAHVPVERVGIELDPVDQTNFSRTVSISAVLTGAARGGGRRIFPVEQLAGNITRIHLRQGSQQIDDESLVVPAILGSNVKSSAHVEVMVQNEDDRALKIRTVALQMRQRKLCFSVPHDEGDQQSPQFSIQLNYGGTGVATPIYDFGSYFNAAVPVRKASLGPETLTPDFHPIVIVKPFSERYPEILWIALVSTLMLLGMIAYRSARSL